MKIIRLIPLLLALAVQITHSANSQVPEVTGSDVQNHIGQEVTICGRVVTYDCDQQSRSLLLDLDSPNWASGVSVAVGREYWGDIGGQQMTNRYLFAGVCATGRVEQAGRRYRVVVHNLDQLPSIRGSAMQGEAFAPNAVQSCGEGVTPPILVREVKPSYTREAMTNKQQGRVYLEGVVLPDGSVGDIRAVYALEPDHGLTRQAIIAVKQWRFRPGTLRGTPVPVVITAELSFTLRA